MAGEGGVFSVILSALLVSLLAGPAAASERPLFWRLERGEAVGESAGTPYPVGSLQKPWVVKAWAREHPDGDPPAVRCDSRSRCWLPSGHGQVSLRRAVAVSCNTYFRRLAQECSGRGLASELTRAGFAASAEIEGETAIGVVSGVTITPRALLQAYSRLSREAWPRNDLRRQLLDGLRDCATTGTGQAIARRGFHAKTGTVPALDGGWRTSGWAVVFDEGSFALLALLARGTGREAAAALDGELGRLRPDAPRTRWEPNPPKRAAVHADNARTERPPGFSASVRVRLFSHLRVKRLLATNRGAFPLRSNDGFIGPGTRVALRPGQSLANGRWEIEAADLRFSRIVRGSLTVFPRNPGADSDALTVVVSTPAVEYAAGVMRAELPKNSKDREATERLGAAILRFLSRGPRHAEADVCDTTHCAWFIGEGPAYEWPTPRHPVRSAWQPDPANDDTPPHWSHERRSAVEVAAAAGGPANWSSSCGGKPLSEHQVWGAGAGQVQACGRHAAPSGQWSRFWPDQDVGSALKTQVERLSVGWRNGVWTLSVESEAGRRLLRYDQAHRLIAARLGWDALPSPANSIRREGSGFRVEGVGKGHRVGLCLGG